MRRSDRVSRRSFLQYSAAAGAAAVAARFPAAPAGQGSDLEEATIAELHRSLRTGRYSGRGLCEAYLARIEAIDRAGPTLRSVIETNPEAPALG
jgi:amidase